MIDAAPFCIHIWDKSLNIIDCNQATVSLFNLSDKQEYLDHFYEFSPEYQPDGSLSKEASVKYIQKAFDEGYLQVEWTHRTLDGELIPSEMTLVSADNKDEYFVIVYVRDMREQKRMMQEIENHNAELERRNDEIVRQNRLMYAINNAAVLLLESDMADYSSAMYQGMELIGRCLETDSVIVWENRIGDDGKIYLRQICVWSSEYLPDEGLFELAQDCQRRIEELTADRVIQVVVRNEVYNPADIPGGPTPLGPYPPPDEDVVEYIDIFDEKTPLTVYRGISVYMSLLFLSLLGLGLAMLFNARTSGAHTR